MIKVRNASAVYNGDGRRIPVFEDVSFEVACGQVLGIFGPNGCGKSTLLDVISGVRESQSGSVQFEPSDERQRVSYIRQNYRADFFGWASLLTNVVLTTKPPEHSRRKHAEYVSKLASVLGIQIDLSKKPERCSGGELQQASILRAFANKPTLLLADEPFSALDYSIARKIKHNVIEYGSRNEVIFMFVTHDVNDLVNICDLVFAIPALEFTTVQNRLGNTALVLDVHNSESSEHFISQLLGHVYREKPEGVVEPE